MPVVMNTSDRYQGCGCDDEGCQCGCPECGC